MLRRATKNDALGIAKVHVDTWKSTYKGIIADEYLAQLTYGKREQMWNEILSQPESFSHVWVVTNGNDEVIGFSSGGKCRDKSLPFDGEIYAIYLMQGSQKRGFGKQLFLESLEQLYRDGFCQMALWVLEDNPTRYFYEAMGGKSIAEKWEEIGGKKLKEIGYGWEDIYATLSHIKKDFRSP
jgi:GNAT superfamily N-acetyltransferase